MRAKVALYNEGKLNHRETRLATGLSKSALYYAKTNAENGLLYQGRNGGTQEFLDQAAYARLWEHNLSKRSTRQSEEQFEKQVLIEVNKTLRAQGRKQKPEGHRFTGTFMRKVREKCYSNRVVAQAANSCRLERISSIRNLLSVYGALRSATKRLMVDGTIKLVHPGMRCGFDAYHVVKCAKTMVESPQKAGFQVFRVALDAPDDAEGSRLSDQEALRVLNNLPTSVKRDSHLPVAIKILVATNAKGETGPIMIVCADGAKNVEDFQAAALPGGHPTDTSGDVRIVVTETRTGNVQLWDMWFNQVFDWLQKLQTRLESQGAFTNTQYVTLMLVLLAAYS